MRPRLFVAVAGLGMCGVASVPLAFVWGAVVSDGALAFLAGVMALLSSPLLLFWLLGPRLLVFAARGIPVPGGSIWRWPRRRTPDGSLDAEFEKR